MPITSRSTATRTRDTMRDPRAVAVGGAAILGALVGIGQLLFAQFTGVLFSQGGVDATTQEAVDESSIVIWISAVAVCLGSCAPRLYLKTPPGRRLRLALAGAAAAGALLSAPVASATAVWARVYGSDLTQPSVLWLVFIGVVLGAVVGIVAVRSHAAAWSLAWWVGVVWVLLLVSAIAEPDATRAVSQLDLGPEWGQSSQFLHGGLLLTVAAVSGFSLGVAAVKYGWGRGLRRWRNAGPLLSVCGPLVVVGAYVTAGATAGSWDVGHLTSLVAAGVFTVSGSWAGSVTARRLRRGPPARRAGV